MPPARTTKAKTYESKTTRARKSATPKKPTPKKPTPHKPTAKKTTPSPAPSEQDATEAEDEALLEVEGEAETEEEEVKEEDEVEDEEEKKKKIVEVVIPVLGWPDPPDSDDDDDDEAIAAAEKYRKKALKHSRPSTRWLMLRSDEDEGIRKKRINPKDAQLDKLFPHWFLALLDLDLRTYEREVTAAAKIVYALKSKASVRRAIKKVVLAINRLRNPKFPCGSREMRSIRDYLEQVVSNAGVDAEEVDFAAVVDKWREW
ncbi:hypothetical protein Q8F55_003045 [Vanrija albida]|uniref:Uncharacterized protein n=1 Tax=Vanrija albida TaxID=181172 RepID=A0ABR3QBH7_9TREE